MDIEALTRRLERERIARQAAERLLEEKSRELYVANQTLEARAAALSEANQLQSRFLANVSHEIRTPMNAVLGILEEATTWEVGEERLALLSVARRSASDLLGLLNDLLDLSKLDARQMDLYPQPTAIGGLLSEVRDLFAATAGAKGLSLVCRGEGFEHPVLVDAGRLRQILTNLMSNAVRFTERGEVTLRAWAIAHGMARFEVRDAGPGIAPEDRERIFQSFVQVPSLVANGGTGLGLSIVSALTQAMGGRLGVESEPGQGATFWIEIPCPPTDQAPIGVPAAAPKKHLGLRVLVVDDNAVNRMVISRHLVGLGCDPVEADSGPRCLELGATERFDAVLMDVLMPEMDGLEACRRLLELQPELPVLACSASVLEEDRRAAQAVGMVGFVPKPVRKAELHLALTQAVQAWAA